MSGSERLIGEMLPPGRSSPPRSSSNPGHAGESYEEFFQGTVPCPTCRGLGRISKDQENSMVALIPLSDKRLKPRRTTLYVGIAILMCLFIGAMLMFFLLPRSVSLSSSREKLNPIHTVVDKEKQYVFLTIRNAYNISNNNYFAVTISDLSVTVLFDTKVMGEAENTTKLTVPMRTYRTHYIELNVTFSGDEGYIAFYCSDTSKFGHTLLMPFDSVVKTNYLGHTEEVTLTTYQHVKCSNGKTDR